MSYKKEALQLKRQLEREGFVVLRTGGDHWGVRTRAGEWVAGFGESPGDRRWRQNAVSQIRRWKRANAARTAV